MGCLKAFMLPSWLTQRGAESSSEESHAVLGTPLRAPLMSDQEEAFFRLRLLLGCRKRLLETAWSRINSSRLRRRTCFRSQLPRRLFWQNRPHRSCAGCLEFTGHRLQRSAEAVLGMP